jgi:hypothetical protein
MKFRHIFLKGNFCLFWPVHGAALDGDWCTASCEDTNFTDESVRLLADKIRNEVAAINKSQGVLKMLSPYM